MPIIGVIDDDEQVLDLVGSVLKDAGHIVRTYASPLRALCAFETNPFDLVTIDIRMPQIDGIELLRRLRQKSDVPAIFLTGSGEEVEELVGLRMGADDFIHKPFSSDVLVERVAAVLRRSRSTGRICGNEQISQNVIVYGDLRMDGSPHMCMEGPSGGTDSDRI